MSLNLISFYTMLALTFSKAIPLERCPYQKMLVFCWHLLAYRLVFWWTQHAYKMLNRTLLVCLTQRVKEVCHTQVLKIVPKIIFEVGLMLISIRSNMAIIETKGVKNVHYLRELRMANDNKKHQVNLQIVFSKSKSSSNVTLNDYSVICVFDSKTVIMSPFHSRPV